jgi:hypothetical protein
VREFNCEILLILSTFVARKILSTRDPLFRGKDERKRKNKAGISKAEIRKCKKQKGAVLICPLHEGNTELIN